MSNTPDYSIYHLHELESALANIDESEKPEEAKLIRKYIEKGGYKYPTSPPIKKVVFVNGIYKWSLSALIFFLLTYNIYVLLAWGAMLSLLPIAVQGAILYMMFRRHKYSRALIKIWCVFLAVSGLFGFWAMYYAPEISVSKLVYNAFALFVGLSYLFFADRSIKLVPYGSNK